MGKRNEKTYTPEEAIKKTARRFGVSEAEVRREIQRSIHMAYFCPDPQARAKMCAIPCAGDMPTPEEFIAYMMKAMAGKASQ